MSHVEKLDVRLIVSKQNRYIFGFRHTFDSEVYFVQNEFQQTKKTRINHINDNHIHFEVSLLFWGIWPTVRHTCGVALVAAAEVLCNTVSVSQLMSKAV